MPNQAKKNAPDQQPGDPLFNLHHAEAEAELQRQNPVAMTQRGLSADDRFVIGDDDAATGPVDRQGQRPGQQPTQPASGSGAGHH